MLEYPAVHLAFCEMAYKSINRVHVEASHFINMFESLNKDEKLLVLFSA